MYLKRLYVVNKWWFVIVTLFIVLQLFINIKQGVVVSPVYHYGMYSGVMMPQKEYSVTEIRVNGQLLQTKNFTPYQWDKITLPVDLFRSQQGWNAYIWKEEVSRLLHFIDSSKYVNSLGAEQFAAWYKNYLSDMLREKIDSVTISTPVYLFDGGQLVKKTN